MQTLRQQALINRRVGVAPMSNFRSAEDSKTFARIWIDGNEIGGYLTYTALDAKSYLEEPSRSLTGVIENLNAYPTFLTPQVTIEFKYMDIETYRLIIKIIQSRNEHIVKYYDIVNDKMVTRKMYFKPEELPTIFQRRLEILAVTNYKVELVGTNAELNLLSIVYHLNPPIEDMSDSTVGGTEEYYSGDEFICGNGAESIKNNATITGAGYTLAGWNSAQNGGGTPYNDGWAYIINDTNTENNVLHLYAQWNNNLKYTVSYNYGLGETYKNTDGTSLDNKEIAYNEVYGTLPTTQAKPIPPYNGEEYVGNDSPYYEPQWYMNPVVTPTSTVITAATPYTIQGNSTIYQLFKTKTYKIHFDMNAGGDTTTPDHYDDISAEYGAMIYKPQDPTREGYTFEGWYREVSPTDEDVSFNFSTMPPSKTDMTTTLYAKWSKNEE